jgi:hypothetical protein
MIESKEKVKTDQKKKQVSIITTDRRSVVPVPVQPLKFEISHLRGILDGRYFIISRTERHINIHNCLLDREPLRRTRVPVFF